MSDVSPRQKGGRVSRTKSVKKKKGKKKTNNENMHNSTTSTTKKEQENKKKGKQKTTGKLKPIQNCHNGVTHKLFCQHATLHILSLSFTYNHTKANKQEMFFFFQS